MLCFIDLETTGLTAAEDKILEVACIVTDDKLVEVARFERVLYWKKSETVVDLLTRPVLESEVDVNVAQVYRVNLASHAAGVNPFVIQMHRDNKLWKESIYGQARSTVDRDLAEFIAAYAGEKPVLAGSTVSFDRTFLAAHLPRAHALLHYRNLDVTSMNEMAKRFWPEIHAARPSDNADPDRAHRAMPDIEQSLWTARYYAAKLTTPIERGGASSRVTQVLATLAESDVSEVPDDVVKMIVDAVLG